MTLDEAGDDDEEKVAEDQTKQTATKRKHNEDTGVFFCHYTEMCSCTGKYALYMHGTKL